MPVTGTLYLDLSWERPAGTDFNPHFTDLEQGAVRRMRQDASRLEWVPDGVKVVVYVGARHYLPDGFILEQLRDASERLNIDVRGTDPEAIRTVMDAIRVGASVVA